MKKILLAQFILLFSLNFVSAAPAVTYTDQDKICYQGLGCFYAPSDRTTADSFFTANMTALFNALDAGSVALSNDGTFSGAILYGSTHGGVWGHFANSFLVGYSCANGDSRWWAPRATCTNEAVNYPDCNQCITGSTMQNNQCVCNNGASNAPSCNACGTGLSLYNNLCVCANGATNSPTCNTCPSGSTMQNNQCVCSNGATPQSNCSQCPAGKVMDGGQCVDGCSMTNVCGQQAQGVMKNGTCTAPSGSGGNINNSCITTFNVSSDHVNPNGAVDFSWSLATLPNNVSSKCGFVDLTTPTPRPIPGLQNLDPSVDRTRITNIQSTTRFCLICQFYNALNNNPLGDAVQHQWIKVIRVGEN